MIEIATLRVRKVEVIEAGHTERGRENVFLGKWVQLKRAFGAELLLGKMLAYERETSAYDASTKYKRARDARPRLLT